MWCDSTLQVLPGSTKLFEHEGALAAADFAALSSINPLGGFGKLCDLLDAK